MIFEKKWVVGPFACNCRLLVCSLTREAILIDPGDEGPRILQDIAKWDQPIHLKGIVHTHAHLDHIGATRYIAEHSASAPNVMLHRADLMLYKALVQQGQLFGMRFDEPCDVTHFVEDEECIFFGESFLKVIHTPGHTPGGVCFQLSSSSDKIQLFSGDTLFKQSIGRTDLWGGDTKQLKDSIKNRLFLLEDEVCVCPGHGPDTTIGFEKSYNPFL